MEAGWHVTQRHGWAWCALAAVLFGAATPATKLIVDNVGPVTLAGLLYLGAAVAVAPFALREQRSTASRRQRSRLMIAVAFGGGLAPVLLVLALDRTPAGTVSLFLNLELVATAIIARVFLQEQIGRRAGLGIVIVVLGGVILAGTAEAGIAVGALLVAATCVCWGIDNAITASLDSYTPSQITLAKGLVAGSVNLALGLLLDGAPVARFVLATSHHGHVHRHEPIEHAHPIDPSDSHHRADAIEVLVGTTHRHLAVSHEHEHLPDIHHRHTH
jgi:drug/metabolite transporter (DMT)-like permease